MWRFSDFSFRSDICAFVFSSVKSFRIWNCIKLKNETVALNNHDVDDDDDETITKTSLKILNNKSTHKSKALNKNKTEIFLGVPGSLRVIVINARRCYNRSKISTACGFSTFWLWTFQFPLATKKGRALAINLPWSMNANSEHRCAEISASLWIWRDGWFIQWNLSLLLLFRVYDLAYEKKLSTTKTKRNEKKCE